MALGELKRERRIRHNGGVRSRGGVLVADWEYPGLGFDPLPGNPQVTQDLEHDARIFGQRMTEQATG